MYASGMYADLEMWELIIFLGQLDQLETEASESVFWDSLFLGHDSQLSV